MRSNNWLGSATVRAAVVAGSAAVAVAVASAIGGWISASYQSASEKEKLQATILVDLVHSNDSGRVEYTRRLIQSGILKDPDGSICMAFIGNACPLSVLQPSHK
jgi:hypothetical protein